MIFKSSKALRSFLSQQQIVPSSIKLFEKADISLANSRYYGALTTSQLDTHSIKRFNCIVTCMYQVHYWGRVMDWTSFCFRSNFDCFMLNHYIFRLFVVLLSYCVLDITPNLE
jgi:hypothetical protein